MTLVLQRHEVADLLSMEDAIALTEQLFFDEAEGKTVVHSPIRMVVPERSFRVVSGVLLKPGIVGARVTAGASDSAALLFSTESGELLAMIAYPFSTLRTGATVAAGTKWLSRPDAKSVALIGTGNNALSLLRGIAGVRPIESVRVYSRQAENRTAFAEQAASQLGIEVTPVDSSKAAVVDTDILICSTNATSPAFDYQLLKPGTHINSMGLPSELAAELYRAPFEVFASSPEQEQHYALYLEGLERQQKRHPIETTDQETWDNIKSVEIAMSGAWKRSEAAITVFRESQGGTGDLMFALAAYERAMREGRGLELSMSG